MTRRLLQTRDRGAVIPIVALLLPVLMLMTGFAVDLGRQRTSRRDMQAAADVIALDMARLADGRVLSDIQLGGGIQPPAETALQQSADRNQVERAKITLVWGTWDAPTSSFMPVVDASVAPNAAQITTTESTDYYFQPGSGAVTRDAIGAFVRDPRAEFLLGSTLVEVTPNQDWLIGKLLTFIIPGADVLGYAGLANAQVSLGDLGAGVGAGTVDELLAAKVTLGKLLDISAEALSAQGNTVGAKVVTDLRALVLKAGAGVENLEVRLGDVLGLTTTDPDAGLVGNVSVPQLLALTAILSGGQNFLSVPPTVIKVAGLSSVGLTLHVIEAPMRVGTHDGASGTTKQVGVKVSIALDVGGAKDQNPCELPPKEQSRLGILLGGVFALLNCLVSPLTTSPPLKVNVKGTIDLDLSVAGVTARQAIQCAQKRLGIDYTSSPLNIGVDTKLTTAVTYDGKPLTLLGIGVPVAVLSSAGPTGSVLFDATDAGPVHRTFADTTNGKPTATIGGQTLGLTNILDTNGVRLTLLDQELPVLGDIATGLVQPMINDIVGAVDSFLVAELSRLLGLNLGAADITPQWMDCDLDGSVLLAR